MNADDEVMYTLEKHAVINIATNSYPMTFTENLFQDNIGTFGGAVLIDSPNFEGKRTIDTPQPELRPYVVFYNNTFRNN